MLLFLTRGNDAMLLKLLIAFLIFLSLVGCRRTITDEAHDRARDAFISGDFSHGSLLLAAGCDTLHSQSVHLLRMVGYQESGNVFDAFMAWYRIRALDAGHDFVEVAAYELMQEFIFEVRDARDDSFQQAHLLD